MTTRRRPARFALLLALGVGLLGVASTGCESKPQGTKKLLGSSDHQQLAAIAAKVRGLKAGPPCDEVMAQARKAIPLLKKIVPGYETIANAAMKDEPLASYLSTLNAIRATMKMSARSYAKEKKSSAKEVLAVYCKSVIDDLGKVKTGK